MDRKSNFLTKASWPLALGIAVISLAANLVTLAFMTGVGPAQASASPINSSSEFGIPPVPVPEPTEEPHLTKAVFAAPLNGGFRAITILEDWTVIQRVTLPPGNYVVNAVANIVFPAPQYPNGVQCRIAVNDNYFIGEPSQVHVGPYWPGTYFFPIPVTLGIKLPTRSKVDLVCRGGGPHVGVPQSQASTITAIQVDRLKIIAGMGFNEKRP